MAISPFLDRVARVPLLLDAAMGTRLIAQGLHLGSDDPCLWVESHPDAVAALHRADVAASAEAVFTNTFGANRTWLARFGRADDVAALNRRAVALARDAVGANRFVLGSIGPTAITAGPAPLLEQAEALLAAGVDALVLETFRFEGALAALAALKGVDRPILVGLFDWPEPIRGAMQQLTSAGAALVGLNCTADGLAIDRFLGALEEAGAPAGWVKPSGGIPDQPLLTPATCGLIARRFARLGRGAMGGCCGTTADHLRAIRAAWDDVASRQQT